MSTLNQINLPRTWALVPASLYFVAVFLKWHDNQLQDMLWLCFSCLAVMTIALGFQLSRLLQATILLEFTAFELWVAGMFNGEFSSPISVFVHLAGFSLALYLSYRIPVWKITWHLALLVDGVIFALSYFYTDPLKNINLTHGLPHNSPLYQNAQEVELLGIAFVFIFSLWANERILMFFKSCASRYRAPKTGRI